MSVHTQVRGGKSQYYRAPACASFPRSPLPLSTTPISPLFIHTHPRSRRRCTTTRGERIQRLCKTATSPTGGPASESQHVSFAGDLCCCPGPPQQAHGSGMRWTVSVPPRSFVCWHHCCCFIADAAAAAACHTHTLEILSCRTWEEHPRLAQVLS